MNNICYPKTNHTRWKPGSWTIFACMIMLPCLTSSSLSYMPPKLVGTKSSLWGTEKPVKKCQFFYNKRRSFVISVCLYALKCYFGKWFITNDHKHPLKSLQEVIFFPTDRPECHHIQQGPWAVIIPAVIRTPHRNHKFHLHHFKNERYCPQKTCKTSSMGFISHIVWIIYL